MPARVLHHSSSRGEYEVQVLTREDLEDETRAFESRSDSADRDRDRDRDHRRHRDDDSDRGRGRSDVRARRVRARPHEVHPSVDARTASRVLALLNDADLAAPLRADKLEECIRLCGAVIDDDTVQAVLGAAQRMGRQAARALDDRSMRQRLVMSSGRHDDGGRGSAGDFSAEGAPPTEEQAGRTAAAVLLAIDDAPEGYEGWCMARGAGALPFLQPGAGSLAARVGQRRRLGRGAGLGGNKDGKGDAAAAAEAGGYVS